MTDTRAFAIARMIGVTANRDATLRPTFQMYGPFVTEAEAHAFAIKEGGDWDVVPLALTFDPANPVPPSKFQGVSVGCLNREPR